MARVYKKLGLNLFQLLYVKCAWLSEKFASCHHKIQNLISGLEIFLHFMMMASALICIPCVDKLR